MIDFNRIASFTMLFRLTLLSSLLLSSVFILPLANGVPIKSIVTFLQNKIVGGSEADIHRYPYVVSIRHYGAHRCGGSLVRSNFVLTAAHCVQGVHYQFLKIVAGTSDRIKGGVIRQAESIVIHDDYDLVTLQNDLAVIKLNDSYEFSDVIQPILLASLGEKYRKGTKGFIAGWGTEQESDHFLPNKLKAVEVYAVDFADCVSAYSGTDASVAEGMICTNSPLGGRDSCEGDAGGPAVIGGKQFGIISWGYGCARYAFPRVHVNVGYYRSWIDSLLPN